MFKEEENIRYLQFWARLLRWAAKEKEAARRHFLKIFKSGESKSATVWGHRTETLTCKLIQAVSTLIFNLLTSKVTLPRGSLSAAMSKYTSGFLFAAAGPLLYRRAAVNAKEQNFILFDRSNIFINSLWCNNSTQVDQQWPTITLTCARGGSWLRNRKLCYVSREITRDFLCTQIIIIVVVVVVLCCVLLISLMSYVKERFV